MGTHSLDHVNFEFDFEHRKESKKDCMECSNWVGAGGRDGERIHPRLNKRDRILLNTLQGSSMQDSKGEIVCNKTVVGSCG